MNRMSELVTINMYYEIVNQYYITVNKKTHNNIFLV